MSMTHLGSLIVIGVLDYVSLESNWDTATLAPLLGTGERSCE